MMMGPAPDTSANSRRTIAFFIIVLVHVLLLYGFNAGLTVSLTEKIFGPIKTEIIDEVKKEEDKPPPPPPKIETPPPFVPPPDISIEIAPTENTTAIQVTTTVRPTEPPPVVAPKQKVTLQPKVDSKRFPLTKPEYPPSEKRAEHSGTVYMQLLVLENGRVGEARVQTSSGYPKLDEAAIAEAKRSWRFVPGSEDGKVVQMWVTVPLVFKLEN